MIIQCEQCSTKFRLDDARIKDKGVKVRCARCRHVFTVTKQQQETGSQPDAEVDFEQPAELPVTVDEPSSVPAVEPPSALLGGDDFGFSFSDDVKDSTAGHGGAAARSSEMDFSDFDFGDAAAEKGGVSAPSTKGGSRSGTTVATPAAAGFDFGAESLFGDVVATPAPEEPSEAITFDFSVEAFADSMGTSGKASGGRGTANGLDASRADEPFSLGEIDFGDELTSVAVQQVNPEALKPAQELLFAPLAEAQEKTGYAADGEFASQEELPPLSIASRRKQSPMFMGLVVALAVVVVAVAGYVGYTMFGAEKTAKESGRITIRAVTAAFVKNSVAGELIVISGEAVNGFTGPRASIQVKGMIYGPNGQVLASKIAFCGNPLTKEQLATMPLDKIEAAMANQFGDSLDNLDVPPGKAVPFMIAFAKPPAGAKDFGVEPAGSTVATEKEP